MGNSRDLGLQFIFIVFIWLQPYILTCLGAGNVTVVCSRKERLALLRFKHSVEDFSGMLSSWVGDDCCLWEGIICDSDSGAVESLHLKGDITYMLSSGGYYNYVREGNLVGDDLNSSLEELRHLKYLDLSGNDFRGSRISEFIGSYKQLIYLNLSYAHFQGILPPHIGNLSNLKVLDLSSNGGLMANDMSSGAVFMSCQ